jgi:hypothetical protein
MVLSQPFAWDHVPVGLNQSGRTTIATYISSPCPSTARVPRVTRLPSARGRRYVAPGEGQERLREGGAQEALVGNGSTVIDRDELDGAGCAVPEDIADRNRVGCCSFIESSGSDG